MSIPYRVFEKLVQHVECLPVDAAQGSRTLPMVGQAVDVAEFPVDRRSKGKGVQAVSELHQCGNLRGVTLRRREEALQRGPRTIIDHEVVGRLTERWALSAKLTWTDGLNRVSGQPLLRVAPIQANLVLRCVWEENRTLSLVGNYVSARPDIGGVTVAAFTTFGFRYDQPFGDGTARIGVDNFFDTSYETLSGYPGPRRTVYVQFGKEF